MPVTQKAVLFVCLGNICRSPIAEAVFKDLIHRKSCGHLWSVDSAALGDYNLNKLPDPRGLKCLQSHGLESTHRARLVKQRDFKDFDYILGMDETNLSELQAMRPPNSKAVIKLLGSYHPNRQVIIEDPYWSDDRAFQTVFQQCVTCCENFLAVEMPST